MSKALFLARLRVLFVDKKIKDVNQLGELLQTTPETIRAYLLQMRVYETKAERSVETVRTIGVPVRELIKDLAFELGIEIKGPLIKKENLLSILERILELKGVKFKTYKTGD